MISEKFHLYSEKRERSYRISEVQSWNDPRPGLSNESNERIINLIFKMKGIAYSLREHIERHSYHMNDNHEMNRETDTHIMSSQFDWMLSHKENSTENRRHQNARRKTYEKIISTWQWSPEMRNSSVNAISRISSQNQESHKKRRRQIQGNNHHSLSVEKSSSTTYRPFKNRKTVQNPITDVMKSNRNTMQYSATESFQTDFYFRSQYRRQSHHQVSDLRLHFN